MVVLSILFCRLGYEAKVYIMLAYRGMQGVMAPLGTLDLGLINMLLGSFRGEDGLVLQILRRARGGFGHAITYTSTRTIGNYIGMTSALDRDLGYINGDGLLIIIDIGASQLTILING